MTRQDPWLISSQDGIIDAVALSVASTGLRKIRLTARERDISALIIQHDYRQECQRSGDDYSAEALITLVFDYLSMPSRLAADTLIRALPAGRAGRHLVEYWTCPVYRQCEANRRARARYLARIAR